MTRNSHHIPDDRLYRWAGMRSVRKLVRLAMPFIVAATGSALLLSCNASDSAVADSDAPPHSAIDSAMMADIPDSSDQISTEREIVTGPYEGNRQVGLTVGERLKQLDSLMRIVPPDSLGVLMAEYDRLLDSVMVAKGLAEKSEITDVIAAEEEEKRQKSSPASPAVADRVESGRETPARPMTVPDNGLVQTNRTPSQEQPAPSARPSTTDDGLIRSTRRSAVTNSDSRTLVQSGTTVTQSSAGQSGNSDATTTTRSTSTTAVRSGENGANSSGRSASTSTTTETRPRRATHRRRTATRHRRRAHSYRPTTTTPSTSARPESSSSGSSRSSSKPTSTLMADNYAEGLANFRAGNYPEAIKNLKPVVNTNGLSYGPTARYYYALSLERNGSLSQASSQFRTLMKGQGAIADKAWLGYARVLSTQGNRRQARRELLDLIAERPKSSQIANARKMLQQI